MEEEIGRSLRRNEEDLINQLTENDLQQLMLRDSPSPEATDQTAEAVPIGALLQLPQSSEDEAPGHPYQPDTTEEERKVE